MMVRLFLAKTSSSADNAVRIASETQLPFLVLVHSETCGHCVRMMPAFREMLTRMGDETNKCVVQIRANAVHEGASHPLIQLIKATSIGVPYLAVVKPSRGLATTKQLVALPDSNDRTAKSLESFARKHMTSKSKPLIMSSHVAKKQILTPRTVVSSFAKGGKATTKKNTKGLKNEKNKKDVKKIVTVK